MACRSEIDTILVRALSGDGCCDLVCTVLHLQCALRGANVTGRKSFYSTPLMCMRETPPTLDQPSCRAHIAAHCSTAPMVQSPAHILVEVVFAILGGIFLEQHMAYNAADVNAYI